MGPSVIKWYNVRRIWTKSDCEKKDIGLNRNKVENMRKWDKIGQKRTNRTKQKTWDKTRQNGTNRRKWDKMIQVRQKRIEQGPHYLMRFEPN